MRYSLLGDGAALCKWGEEKVAISRHTNEIFPLFLAAAFQSISFWLYSLSVACVVSAWHFLPLMVGGTTAVMKAAAISKMAKIGPVSLSW